MDKSPMMDSNLIMTDKKNWLQLLAFVTGSINQELLLRNEYLAAENHILKSQIKGRLQLSDRVLPLNPTQ
jgi:hypothetical protein